MKHITVSVDEETHRLARARAAELETSVSGLVRTYLRNLTAGSAASVSQDTETLRLSPRDLDDVLADFDARGVGLRSSGNLTRNELYDEATSGPSAVH
ncbi:MAG: hypothetical protein OXE02_02820 [Chloroflexi bacterium]|nr:hypothetical protein [Chloroflexota bacterium]